MSATPAQARDEINALFKAAWDADESSCDVPLHYDDMSQQVPNSGAWARITIRHFTGGNDGISNSHFFNAGTVFVQIFTPFDDGGVLNDALVLIAKQALQGKSTSPGRVWFRRVRLNEVGPEGQWFQTNVLADFEYEEN